MVAFILENNKKDINILCSVFLPSIFYIKLSLFFQQMIATSPKIRQLYLNDTILLRAIWHHLSRF